MNGAITAVDTGRHEALAALCAQCLDEPWTRDGLARLLATPGAFALLAHGADGAPVGFAIARAAGGECDILAFGVLAPYRRRGLGRKVLRGCLARAQTFGARRCVLEVAEDNHAALALYRAHGFVTIGRRSAYYRRPAGAVSALILACALPAVPAAAPSG